MTDEKGVTKHGVLLAVLWVTMPEQIFSAVQYRPTRYIVVAILGHSSVRELIVINIRNTKVGSVVMIGKHSTWSEDGS